MSNECSSHDVRVADTLCRHLASLAAPGPEVYIRRQRPTYRSDAKFYCGQEVALVVGDRALLLRTEWYEGEEDFRDFSTWTIVIVEGWTPDESWVRERDLEVGPLSEIRVVDEAVDGALSDRLVIFTRALLLGGEEQVLSIAADVEDTSGIDLTVSDIAVQEYLDLAHAVRQVHP